MRDTTAIVLVFVIIVILAIIYDHQYGAGYIWPRSYVVQPVEYTQTTTPVVPVQVGGTTTTYTTQPQTTTTYTTTTTTNNSSTQ